ncbi:MAG: hypothetical protein ACI9KE_003847 [Polyangiales bacterium]|jgi:hypothetical protein
MIRVLPCLLVGALVFSTSVLAQEATSNAELASPPSPSAEDEREARALFLVALQHIENEELAEAVGALGRSLRLVPRVSTALNLAMALQSIGKVIESIRLLREIASGRYGDADPRMNVPGEIERVSSLVGTAHIAVTSTAEGDIGEVVIAVDGVVRATLEQPGATSFPINPGSHVVSVSAVDHESAREVVVVESGGRTERTLHMRQMRDVRPGILTIESLADARIDIDGYGSGVGTLRLELEPREYRVVVTGDQGSDESLVEIAPGRSIRLYLEPPTRKAWQSPWLWTAVGIVVAGAAVAVGWRISQIQRAPFEDDVFGNIPALRMP